jgi:uncharacterized oxidoreductase
MRIPYYVDMIEQGDIVSGAELTIKSESPAHVAADANWGFGQLQARRLTQRLIDKAHRDGVGAGTMIRCSHTGRLGEYCELAADEGFVSMLMVNTHGAARRVAPPGGAAPRLGTNPLAMAAPHPDGSLLLDFSTSATAEGKVRVKRIAGQPCPEGWLLDSKGRPTTDPHTLYADPPGTILPMGGPQPYKGFGLALMIDIFTGAVSGGLCSREKPITPKGNCVFELIVNPDRFGGAEHFAAEVAQLVRFTRDCPLAEGAKEILLPGDPERRLLTERSAKGIPLDGENWSQLVRLAHRLDITPPV